MNESIKVSINPAKPVITVKVLKPTVAEFKLKARKALNGDIMIFDHPDIDIVLMTEKKKIVAFAKDLMNEAVYGAESRLLEFLRNKGIVAFDSIQGGNVYGSLEGNLLQSEEIDSLKLTLLNVSKWIESERPHFEAIQHEQEEFEKYLSEPGMEDSTELGEVPHEEEKGSMKQRGMFAPYLYGRYTY